MNFITGDLRKLPTFEPSDPATWTFPLPSNQRQLICDESLTPKFISKYPKVGKRAFNPKHYQSVTTGERRDWLMYSESSNSLFCLSCCLFPVSTRASASSPWTHFGNGQSGFQDFLHQSRGINDHERSDLHFQSTLLWKEFLSNRKTGKSIDVIARQEISKEISFWKQVLHGLLDAIMFLAKNNLAFQGTSCKLGEPSSGNFLSLVELLSKYYQPLAQHISRIKKSTSKVVTYLSNDIQNEFINIAAERVRAHIIHLIKERKYFSIMFDATPDISHNEQISQVIRTVNASKEGVVIEEHFLGFIHMDLKTGEDLANTILKSISEDGLEIENCRGQGYDNGANMAGKYNGVQAKIKQVNPQAVFIPCAAHSLNLVGQNSAAKVLQGKLILGVIQNLYTFFSASPYRWNKLKDHVKITLKSQSSTRWSSKFSAVSAVTTQFEKIVEALLDIINSDSTNAHTLTEANALVTQVYTFRFLLGSIIWKMILERINMSSVILQTVNISVGDATKHLAGLLEWLIEFKKYGFETAYNLAMEISKEQDLDINSGFGSRITRGRKPSRFCHGNDDEHEQMTPLQKFKHEYFDAILEKITDEFQLRFSTMKSSNEQFGILWGNDLLKLGREDMILRANELSSFYAQDLIKDDFIKEIGYLKSAVVPFLEDKPLEATSAVDILTILFKHEMNSQFPNVVTALKIFLTLPVSVASNERSFSKLRILKNYCRSTMGQNRLSNLAILSIEHEIAKSLSYDSVIDDFATRKCRKVHI